MHPLVAEVDKQCNDVGFIFAREAHICPHLYYQG